MGWPFVLERVIRNGRVLSRQLGCHGFILCVLLVQFDAVTVTKDG